jgi:hypothetical protein
MAQAMVTAGEINAAAGYQPTRQVSSRAFTQVVRSHPDWTRAKPLKRARFIGGVVCDAGCGTATQSAGVAKERSGGIHPVV